MTMTKTLTDNVVRERQLAEFRETFLKILRQHPGTTITRRELIALCVRHQVTAPRWFTGDDQYRVGRGVWTIPQNVASSLPTSSPTSLPKTPATPAIASPALKLTTVLAPIVTLPNAPSASLIPEKDPSYVPFGNFDALMTILASTQFAPVFITGQTGNGKTMSVEQACAKLKRKFVCVSMTPETDEGDLLGNFVLVDHTMVWKDGPVTMAAKEGAILCLDEIDYGAANLTTLQRVLEGKPFLLKKKNELITPAPGFNIVATANTKGQGSEDGRYLYTNVMNEAFLERFPIMFQQEWAPKSVEKKILLNVLRQLHVDDDAFAGFLIDWAGIIRKTFEDGGCSDVVSTRRLVQICKTYAMFRDRMTALQYCLNRFEKETITSFLDLYTKVDASVGPIVTETETVATAVDTLPTAEEVVVAS